MPLDTDSLNYVRSMLPTTTTADEYHVTDAQLNYLYDNKADSDADKTIAFALRQMCIKLSNKVARTNTATLETIQQQQEREAVCAAAKEWAEMTGILGGGLTVGTLNLGIYAENPDE